MKNQYFGDINDYRKYGLLCVLTRVSGLKIGVCWLLTSDDKRKDGEFRNYLSETQQDQWKSFDRELYDKLQSLKATRSVTKAKECGLIPNAEYYNATLEDGQKSREKYFHAMYETLGDCPLFFLDPDNGIEVKSVRVGKKDSAKYIYWAEIMAMYNNGHSLLIYQHFPHVQRDQFILDMATQFVDKIGAKKIVAFRTSHVVFFLVQQPQHEQALKDFPQEVLNRWKNQFKIWSSDGK